MTLPEQRAAAQVAAAYLELDELRRKLKLVQSHAKNAMNMLPERWNRGFQAGLRQAIPYEKELTEALAVERKARQDDNAGFTADIMKLEEQNAELHSQLLRR